MPSTLTKQAVKRLFESPVLVKTWNGTFNTATVEAVFSRYRVELTVEASHPSLEWASGRRNQVRLVYWTSSSGSFLEVPEELKPLVEQLRLMATMSAEEARKLNEEMVSSAA